MIGKKKIFLIAGEESGDNLGSKLMRSLKAKYKGNVEFIGVGGNKMAYEGLHTIFPMQEINMMGFVEIVPHIPNIMKRMNETIERIKQEWPDIIITIDSPGFNFRIAKKLKEQGVDIPRMHYVAPSVWAYKPERAKKCAKLFDHLLCLLPWEPKFFEPEGLKTTFIGHPVFEDLVMLDETEKSKLKAEYEFKHNDKIVAILPGSRPGEIKRMLHIFIDAANKVHEQNPNTKFILMPTENLRQQIAKVSHLIPNCIVVSEQEEKRRLLQICDAAMVKSGTVALEVAALRCPHVICYKVNPISHFIIDRMLVTDYVNLVNISANKEIIREFIQNDVTAENLARETLLLLNSEVVAAGQLEDSKYELQEMGMGMAEKPSDKAADVIYNLINKE